MSATGDGPPAEAPELALAFCLLTRSATSETEARPEFVARAVLLASELGIIAKMDLIKGEDGSVTSATSTSA